MKLKPVRGDSVEGFYFFCPGCDFGHVFYTTGSVTWTFDGNMDRPTFSPSLLNTCDNHPDPKQRRCHLFLTAGRIEFMPDCSHDLAGQVVDLPELPY